MGNAGWLPSREGGYLEGLLDGGVKGRVGADLGNYPRKLV